MVPRCPHLEAKLGNQFIANRQLDAPRLAMAQSTTGHGMHVTRGGAALRRLDLLGERLCDTKATALRVERQPQVGNRRAPVADAK